LSKANKTWKRSNTPFLDLVQGLPGGEGYLSDTESNSDKEEDEEFFVLPELMGTSDLNSLRDHCLNHRSDLCHRFYNYSPLFEKKPIEESKNMHLDYKRKKPTRPFKYQKPMQILLGLTN
jgi:hypothetical protein